jgi:hypothetical protein
MWTSAGQTQGTIVVSLLNLSAHNLLYGGGCSSSQVCACVCEGESVSVSKLEMLLRGDVDFRSTNEVEVFIIAGSVSDDGVVEYVSISESVSVSVSVSKLETLLHCCNSNWRHFSVGRSSSVGPRTLCVPVDPGYPYAASRVEEWGCRHPRFRVKVQYTLYS